MTDIEKALKAARDELEKAFWNDASFREMARAAILAFLRAMPDNMRAGKLTTQTAFPSAMVRAIEALGEKEMERGK